MTELRLFLHHHKYTLLLLLIIFLGSLVRLNNFPAWFGFDYDQEINAWIAKTILVDHKPVLIGPETSVGGMYVGPFYNYLVALFYFFARMDPVGTLGLNILLAALTIGAVYLVGKCFFSPATGIFAALIYAFSQNLIFFDRTSWNPSPMPLVTLLALYFLRQYLTGRNRRDLFLASLFVAAAIQLHFMAIFLIAFFVLALLFFGGKKLVRPVSNLLVIFPSFAVSLFPLVMFDLRHGFLNSRHFLEFFLAGGAGGAGLNFSQSLLRVTEIFVGFSRAVLYNYPSSLLDYPAGGLLAAAVIYAVINFRRIDIGARLMLLLGAVGFSGLVFYRGPIPSQYLLFIFPVFVLLWAKYFERVWRIPGAGKILGALMIPAFCFFNLPQVFTNQNDLGLKYKRQAVDYIIADAGGDSFKVDFITNYGLKTGFKYLFWLRGNNLVEDMSVATHRTYKIILPYFLVDTNALATRFGAVGIIKL